MKKLLFLACIVGLLVARENPFVATRAFIEQRDNFNGVDEYSTSLEEKLEYEEQQYNKVEKKIDKIIEKEIKKPKKIKEKEVQEVVVIDDKISKLDANQQNKQKQPTQKIVAKNNQKAQPKQQDKVVVIKNNIKVITLGQEPKEEKVIKQAPKKSVKKVSKPKTTKIAKKQPFPNLKILGKGEHKILPFLSINVKNETLEIKSKYNVFRKLDIDNGKVKKIVLDYYGQTNFFTKRYLLKSKNFKKITIGNHKKDYFFRVVVELNDSPTKYNASYVGTSVVTISK
jgi:hypothetical protein